MGVKQDILGKYQEVPGTVLTLLLILAGLVIIGIAIGVKSPFIKAAALAYVTLP